MVVGLAALISTLTGLFGGSVPRIFEMFEKKQTFAQELKIRELESKFRREEQEMQIALAEKGISGKIDESYYEAMKTEVQANAAMAIEMARQLSVPTGYPVLDFVNAAIRPFFFVTTILLFFVVIIQFVLTTPDALAAQAATQFWIAFEGAAGYIVGYRSSIKAPLRDK